MQLPPSPPSPMSCLPSVASPRRLLQPRRRMLACRAHRCGDQLMCNGREALCQDSQAGGSGRCDICLVEPEPSLGQGSGGSYRINWACVKDLMMFPYPRARQPMHHQLHRSHTPLSPSQYPQGLSPSLDLSSVFGIASNTSRLCWRSLPHSPLI